VTLTPIRILLADNYEYFMRQTVLSSQYMDLDSINDMAVNPVLDRTTGEA
jgi:hypothetical protein